VISRPHAPVFTDDSGGRQRTVQWGGRAIALACMALWAALAVTFGTQVSLPGLDRLPSLGDGLRRAILPDQSRLEALPDIDRRPMERTLVSGVELPRSTARPVDDSTRPRAVVQRGTDQDQSQAVVAEGRYERATPVRARSSAAEPVPTTPASPKADKPVVASGPPTVKPNPHANPRAKAVVPKAQAKTRDEAEPGPVDKPRNAKAAGAPSP